MRRGSDRAPVSVCARVSVDRVGDQTWDVAALVTHQGMVHRWAAANVRGDSAHRTEDSEAAAAAAADLLAYLGLWNRTEDLKAEGRQDW
jgi:hypothetical protein